MYKGQNIYTKLDDCYQLTIICRDNVYHTYFDKKFYDILVKYHWRVDANRSTYYVATSVIISGKYKTLYMSNIIMNFTPNKVNVIDHIDRNGLNNRCSNLRHVTLSENLHNSVALSNNNTTKMRGISYSSRDGLYSVDFSYNHKRLRFNLNSLNAAVYIRTLCEYQFLGNIRNTTDDSIKNELINELCGSEKFALLNLFNHKLLKFYNYNTDVV